MATNNNFAKAYAEANDNVKKETGLAIPAVLLNAAVSFTFFGKAINAGRKGNYGRGIFYGVMWHGWANNAGIQLLQHRIKTSA